MVKSKKQSSSVNVEKSSFVRFGRRTYFFDVNQTKDNKKYLKITESQYVGEGEDRIYNSFILFPDNMPDFQNILSEAAMQLG